MSEKPCPTSCPSCASKKEITLFHDRVWNMKEGSVFRCGECEAAFIHPMLTQEKEKIFYENYNKHVKARGVTTSSGPGEFHKKSQPIARERLAVVEDFFPKEAKVLEVGSSTGAFLELLKDNECTGVEPATDNRSFSEQFAEHTYENISHIPLSEKFHIICMFHVFEHIRDPQTFLSICKKLLTTKGKIIIEVPYIEDPLLTIYNLEEFKNFYFQPMHPFVHSLKSLRNHFGKAGLVEDEVIFYQRYGLDNHLSWLSKKKPGGDSYFSSLFGDNNDYKKALTEAQKTDTIFYIAQNSLKAR